MGKLEEYRRKRRFERTPEPAGAAAPPAGRQFVVQKHAARRMHYDLRLEIEGVLKSWAVPKGPTLNPSEKRLAVMTEDHPLEYAGFEGLIPEGHYGAGPVMVWDRGLYEVLGELDAARQLARGEIKFALYGEKLRGGFALVKLRHSEKGNEWLLIKHKDAAEPAWQIDAHDGSVLTGRTLPEIAAEAAPKRAPSPILPEELAGARKASMPARLEPMLAGTAAQPFSDPAWAFEIKWDGVRALAWVRDARLELRSRTGRLITPQYPELAGLPGRLLAREAILDGEVVLLDEHGRSDFERLQERMHNASPSPAQVAKAPVTCYVFDLLYCDGYDLRAAPLLQRKELLRRRLRPDERIRYCDHQLEHGRELFELARAHGLEGMVAKRGESPYTSGRTAAWLKLKSRDELDGVVAGWTEPRGAREHLGALLVGLYDGRRLVFVGHVGSGFDQKTLRKLIERLRAGAAARCPFASVPETNEKAFWARPHLVARIAYSGWTQEQRLRHPVFLGLRDDVRPDECLLPSGLAAPAAPPPAAPVRVGHVLAKRAQIEAELFRGCRDDVTLELDGKRVRLTNLNKVFFPESGYTKRHLLAYYYRVAGSLLPFLKDRPLVLRRYPDGIHGLSFFQKDAREGVPDWIDTITIPSEGKREEVRYVVANDCAALLCLTNLGCIDHNPWSSRTDDLQHPDYVFFDLDPAEGTAFSDVVAIARGLAQKLEELGVRFFLKTSGATGMHLYVPVERGYTYEQLRLFAEIVARLVAAEQPGRVTQERAVAKRPAGKTYIDVSQNAFGRPLAAPYVVRAFPRAPVSAPIARHELRPALRPDRLNLKTILARREKKGDLWATFWESRQRLEEAARRLGAFLPARPRR